MSCCNVHLYPECFQKLHNVVWVSHNPKSPIHFVLLGYICHFLVKDIELCGVSFISNISHSVWDLKKVALCYGWSTGLTLNTKSWELLASNWTQNRKTWFTASICNFHFSYIRKHKLKYLPPHLHRNKPCWVGHPCSGLYNKAFILAFTAVLNTTTL